MQLRENIYYGAIALPNNNTKWPGQEFYMPLYDINIPEQVGQRISEINFSMNVLSIDHYPLSSVSRISIPETKPKFCNLWKTTVIW